MARIKEIVDIMLIKNINFRYYNKISNNLFLEIDKRSQQQFIEKIFTKLLSKEDNLNVIPIDRFSDENLLETSSKLVHFGWKNEAIPVSSSKKSILARFFDTIFG